MEVFPLFPRARTQIAAQSLNVLVLLNEGCFQKDFLSLQWIAKLQLQADQNWHVLAVTEKMSIPLASWESLWVWSELSMIMEVVWSWFLFTLGGLDTRSVAERTSGWSGKGHSRWSKRGSIPASLKTYQTCEWVLIICIVTSAYVGFERVWVNSAWFIRLWQHGWGNVGDVYIYI